MDGNPGMRDGRAAGKRGETIVESLVAVALVSVVAIPALAAIRGALAMSSKAAARAAAASETRFKAMSDAALLRFESEDPGESPDDRAFPGSLPPLRTPAE